MADVRPLDTGRYGPVFPFAELGVGDTRVPTGQARWDVARWDDPLARWSGIEPTWLDVSCHVMAATSTAGRVRVLERFTIGSADIALRNLDGWADLLGPPVPPATLPLRPGRQFRYGVTTPTGRHLMHRGYIDEALPLYVPYGTDMVQCNLIDALGEVGRLELAAADVGVETVTARLHRILDAVAWPASYRDVAPSSVSVIAATLEGPASDLLGVAADSAGGAVFGDLDGRIVYRPRDWQTYPPGTPPDATVGNVGAGDVCPQSWELSFRRRDVAGVVDMRRADGSGVTRLADLATRAAVGPEPFRRDDLETADDSTLGLIADRAIDTRSLATMPRVEAVWLDAANDPGDGRTVELMATARPEVPTRLRCRLVELGGRTVFDRDMFVTTVDHTIDDAGRWQCRLGLDVAAPFAAVGGRWDAAGWDQALWADLAARLEDLLTTLEGAAR